MELTKEVIEAAKLTEDQVKAVSEFGKDYIANEKKTLEDQFSGKANENAEKIIGGAAAKVEETTKIKRNEGEKIADYLQRVSTEFLTGKQSELDQLKKDYEDKIKNVKDAGTLKDEFEKMKLEKDEILKKYADYDELKEKATKADEYGKQLSGLKLEVAFNGVKPSFPDTVNTYEAKAKWDEFKKRVLEKYDIELVDNEPMAISKENKFKTVKLSELVTKDETISALAQGRQQSGTGGKEKPMTKIEGVPFDVPENATTAEISKLVREHVVKTIKDVTSKEYAKQFAEIFGKIKKQKTAA